MHRKKLYVLLLAAVAAISLAAVPSAQAAKIAEVNCAFQGLAGNIHDDPVTAILNGTGGSGFYDFSGDAVACTYVDQDGDVITGGAHIVSHGTFDNTVCGTGFAHGNKAVGQTTITPDKAGVTNVTQVDYEIVFVAGQGVLTVTKVNGAAANGGGVVQIRPRPLSNPDTGNCVTSNVTAFDVSGTFSAVLPTQGV